VDSRNATIRNECARPRTVGDSGNGLVHLHAGAGCSVRSWSTAPGYARPHRRPR